MGEWAGDLAPDLCGFSNWPMWASRAYCGMKHSRCVDAFVAVCAVQALSATFMDLNRECCARFAKSGTTATVAVVCGWELLVANVGDSCAYLDTGDQVVRLSASHRLDTNHDEQKRVRDAGGERSRPYMHGVVYLYMYGVSVS